MVSEDHSADLIFLFSFSFNFPFGVWRLSGVGKSMSFVDICI